MSIVLKGMEEKLNTQGAVTDENREVALGICFGSGVGIFLGALMGNVMLGLSGGGVLGIIVGTSLSIMKKSRH